MKLGPPSADVRNAVVWVAARAFGVNTWQCNLSHYMLFFALIIRIHKPSTISAERYDRYGRKSYFESFIQLFRYGSPQLYASRCPIPRHSLDTFHNLGMPDIPHSSERLAVALHVA